MKMKKKSRRAVPLCGAVSLCSGRLLCRREFRATKYQCCARYPGSGTQQLTWTPVDQSKTQSTQLSMGGQQLNVPGISGPLRLIAYRQTLVN